jgi:hypothetical protein
MSVRINDMQPKHNHKEGVLKIRVFQLQLTFLLIFNQSIILCVII